MPVGESLLIEKAKTLRQKQISYFTATYHVAKANHFLIAQKDKISKFQNFSKISHLAHSQRELTRKLTETYGEICMCLAAN